MLTSSDCELTRLCTITLKLRIWVKVSMFIIVINTTVELKKVNPNLDAERRTISTGDTTNNSSRLKKF